KRVVNGVVVTLCAGCVREMWDDLIGAYRAPTPDTVEVRIAVAVDHEGLWDAAGSAGWRDDATEKVATTALAGTRVLVSFITAHVPRASAPAEVQASVESGPVCEECGRRKRPLGDDAPEGPVSLCGPVCDGYMLPPPPVTTEGESE
ncbi:hypothetical protein LCGC14_3029720, partial [marine sediment metagenome]